MAARDDEVVIPIALRGGLHRRIARNGEELGRTAVDEVSGQERQPFTITLVIQQEGLPCQKFLYLITERGAHRHRPGGIGLPAFDLQTHDHDCPLYFVVCAELWRPVSRLAQPAQAYVGRARAWRLLG